MRINLTTIIVLIALLHASAGSYAQITLHEKDVDVKKVFKDIEQQTSYTFMYDSQEVNSSLRVSVDLKNATLEEALKNCFKNLPLAYKIVDQTILVKKAIPINPVNITPHSSALPPIHLSGIVTDTAGIAIANATLKILKKQNGTEQQQESTYYSTRANGLFEFDADEGDEIDVSVIGYQVYKFKVKKIMPFQTIVLHLAVNQLSEVVVQTGYQTLSKERATGSFSKPDMQVFSERSSTMDVIGRLDGQIPGLTVSQNSITDPITNQSTRSALIRGTSSVLLSTEPLYVVNGVIVTNFGSINVDDIADITVLKDAAASAIWGSQAANGVIVVTTKAGKKNQTVKISYNGFANFQGKPDLNRQKFLSSSQYIEAEKEIFDPVTFPYSSLYNSFISPAEQILYNQNSGVLSAAQANLSLDSLSKIDNRQQIKDLFYRNAYTTNQTFSASGGGKAYSFYSSLGYVDVHSSTPGQSDNTYKINLNQTFTPNSILTLSLNTSLADRITHSNNAASIGPNFLPYQLFKDASGNNINMPYMSGYSPAELAYYQSQSGVDLSTYNPLNETGYGNNNGNNLAINIVSNATVKIWNGISYQGTYGYSTAPGTATTYNDNQEYALKENLLNFTIPGSDGSAPTYLIPATGGNYSIINTNQRNWTVRNQLVYNFASRNGLHQINLQGGQEARESVGISRTTNLMGYDPNLLTYPPLDYASLESGVGGTVTGYGYLTTPQYVETQITQRYTSYFGLASYTFNHAYSVDGSWREDHSNVFGTNTSSQNKPVYSIGGKWILSEESFVKQLTWINNLAFRATYGVTGNSPYVGAASTLDELFQPSIGTSVPPIIAGNEYSILNEKNANLSWESTQTVNLGVDFSVLASRLTGTLEYYHKNTTNLLGQVQLNPFSGESTAIENVGNLKNSGINIGLNSINIHSKTFTWTTGIVFAINKNKLVSYDGPEISATDAVTRLTATYVLNEPLSPLYAYKYAGLDDVGAPQIKLANGTITKDPTAATAKDLVYKGSIVPKMNGGISNSFRYKQFELDANIVYSLGAVMRRDVNQFYSGRLTGSQLSFFSGNVSAEFADRWQKPGDEKTTNIPAYVAGGDFDTRNTNYYTEADINVVSASYFKLRDATLSYKINPAFLRWLKVESASIRFQVNNLLEWRANKYGIDPEFRNYYNGYITNPGAEKSFTLGANVNF